jgi:tetratricopeptide (TPR) repeat protein
VEGYELKIALLRKLGRQADIVPSLEQYVQSDPHNTTLKLLLARQYEAAGRAGRAERIYQDVIKEGPSADAYRGLFHLYQNTRGTDGMEQVLFMLDDALKTAGKKDNDADKSGAAAKARVMLLVLRDDRSLVGPLLGAAERYLRGSGKLGYETRHLLAVLAGRANQLDRAEQFYRRCLPAPPQNEAAVYNGLLRVLWQGHKYAAIAEVCRRGLREARATRPLVFHLDLALALPHLGQMKDAITHADTAVRLAGDDLKLFARLRRVSVLNMAEKYEAAIAECRDLLKEYKQPADVHDIRYLLSSVYTSARELAKAEDELRRLIRTNPDDATAYNDLGYLWADQNKNLEEAEEYIRKAIALDRRQKKTGPAVGADEDRDNAAYVDSLGWVLFRRGQLEAGRRELEKAVTLPDGDDDPVVWDHLGDVYFRLDQPGRARAAWHKAITLYEVEKRRTMDYRYKEIKHKLKLLEGEPETQP